MTNAIRIKCNEGSTWNLSTSLDYDIKLAQGIISPGCKLKTNNNLLAPCASRTTATLFAINQGIFSACLGEFIYYLHIKHFLFKNI